MTTNEALIKNIFRAWIIGIIILLIIIITINVLFDGRNYV
jgi:hypothetical protein